jgi:hypothetical protein
MPITSRFRARQGELFAATMPPPQVPQEDYQRMVRLLARMMNEHLKRFVFLDTEAEAGDE